jgi:hypothetical protein
MIPEIRLSPDGNMVALRFAGEKHWTAYGNGCFEKFLTDEDVADWTPLAPPRHVERVTCPWCRRSGRALDERGRIRHHFGNSGPFYTSRCPGAGRLPSEYETPARRSA